MFVSCRTAIGHSERGGTPYEFCIRRWINLHLLPEIMRYLQSSFRKQSATTLFNINNMQRLKSKVWNYFDKCVVGWGELKSLQLNI